MKQFVCAECGHDFESGSPQARYCTLTCQRKAKAKRRTARDSILLKSEEQDTRIFKTVSNPTVAQLARYAEMILEGLMGNKVVRFVGEMPYWITPTGITLGEQFGIEPRQWIMQRQELGALDLLLQK